MDFHYKRQCGEKNVAKGFQQPSTDDELTYAPVCRLSALRVQLPKSVNNDWPIKQIDVPTAFLHGTVKEDVFFKRPEGVKVNFETCKLNRALYGLRVTNILECYFH